MGDAGGVRYILGDGRAATSALGIITIARTTGGFLYRYVGNDALTAGAFPNILPSGADWIQVTFTAEYWSGGYIKVYCDGVQRGAHLITASANLKIPDGTALWLGTSGYNQGLFNMNGIMDEFNIENYVMQPDDIAGYYQRTFLRYQDSRSQFILPSGDAEPLVLQQAMTGATLDIFRAQNKHGFPGLIVNSAAIVNMPSAASIASAQMGSLSADTSYIYQLRQGATALYEEHFVGLDATLWTSGGAGLGWGLVMECAPSYPMGWITFSANASTGSATDASLFGYGGVGTNQSPYFACAIEPSGEDLRNVVSGFVGLFAGPTARIGFVFTSWGNGIKHSIYCVATSGANASAQAVAGVWFSGASGGAGYAHKYAVSVMSGASAIFYIDNVARYSTGAAVLWPSCMMPMVWFSYAEPGGAKTLYWRTDYFYVYGRPNNL